MLTFECIEIGRPEYCIEVGNGRNVVIVPPSDARSQLPRASPVVQDASAPWRHLASLPKNCLRHKYTLQDLVLGRSPVD